MNLIRAAFHPKLLFFFALNYCNQFKQKLLKRLSFCSAGGLFLSQIPRDIRRSLFFYEKGRI